MKKLLKKIGVIACGGCLMFAFSSCGYPADDDSGSSSSATTSSKTEPTVTAKFGETPTFSWDGVSETPPSDLVVAVLSKGDGKEVKSGQTITVNYSGVIWGSTEPFDSSFARGESIDFGIGVGQVIQGWDQGLVGQKIGSRVLLTIPPDLGYGSQGSGSIPGNSTLVFVVDIIDSK